MNLTNEDNFTPRKALIYCRVSSKKQKDEGSGLDGQEHRCREHADKFGLEVEAVFPDNVTGGGDFMKRPGMVALLAYLDAQTDKRYVVIFDDLKRLARDAEFYRKLRREFISRNALVYCLNFKIEDTPEGKFFETIIAAQGELEREQNGRQVRQKMKARIEQGYAVFRAPTGLKYVEVKRGGKELFRDEPTASIVQEALEGFACGRFETQSEVKRFLEGQPDFPKDMPNGEIRAFKVTRMLKHCAYAGYVEARFWKISRRKGNHDGLISYKTYDKIQKRLTDKAYAPARKDINEDFPLRGFVSCADCEKPLRSGWSKGKYKKYPYYLCQTKTCESYGKSLRRDDVERKFEAVLKNLCPSQNTFGLARTMIESA